MGSRACGQPGPLRGEDEAAEQHVRRHAEHQRADDESHGSAVEETPEGKLEDKEGDVAAKEWIGRPEGGAVDVGEHHVPRRAGPEPGKDADDRDDGEKELPDEWLEDGTARKAQLIVELPQYVRGGSARGEPEIAVDEDEDDGPRAQKEPAAQGENGGEDLREADLDVPEPVGVQRDGLARSGQGDEPEEQPEADPGRTPSVRHREPPSPGARRAGGVKTGAARRRRVRLR